MKKDKGKKKIEQDLKEMFRKQADPVDPDRLETIRRHVLAAVPEITALPAFSRFRRPALALASGLSVLIIALGIYLSRQQTASHSLDTFSRIVENDEQLDQLVLLLDEFISPDSPARDFLSPGQDDLGTGIFTESDLLPAFTENGSS